MATIPIDEHGNLHCSKLSEFGDWESEPPQADKLIFHTKFNGSAENIAPPIDYTPTFGLLYNQYAVDTGKLAPTGWHIPTDAEFTTLATTLGGTTVAGGKMKSTGFEYFYTPNTGAVNDVGWNGRAGGLVSNISGNLLNFLLNAWYWTSTNGITHAINYNNDDLIRTTGSAKTRGHQIRCIKNDSTWTLGDTVNDIDGNVYQTIKIGNQVWIASDFRCTKYNDNTPITLITDPTTWINRTSEAYRNITDSQPTVVGATYGNDRFDIANKAVVLDGIDDYVLHNVKQGRLAITPNSSISFWFRFNENIDTVVNFYQNILGIASGDNYLRFGQGIGTSNLLYKIYGETKTNSDFIILSFKNKLRLGKWYHCCITQNDLKLWSLYIDGVLQSTDTTTDDILYFDRIGGGFSGTEFNGSFDEFKFWNTLLPPEEVLEDFNSFKGKFSMCTDGIIRTPRLIEDSTMTNDYEIYKDKIKIRGHLIEE